MNETLEIRDRLAEQKAEAATSPECYHTVCAWCGKSKGKSGRWFHGDISVMELTTHGICPGCLVLMKEDLKQYRSMHLAPVPQTV